MNCLYCGKEMKDNPVQCDESKIETTMLLDRDYDEIDRDLLGHSNFKCARKDFTVIY